MELPDVKKVDLQVTFRSMPACTLVESYVRHRAEALAKQAGELERCRVVIDHPNPEHRHGAVFRVVVDVGLPSREAPADPGRVPDDGHEDVFIAIRDAFDDARRRLEGEAARRNGAIESGYAAATSGGD